MRRLFYALLLSLAVYFIFTHREELQLIVEVLGQGDWRWMLAAIGAGLIWIVVIGAALQSTYRLVGIHENLDRLVPLTTAANFVNVVAPSYGAGALAVLIADGRQRKKPAAKVSTAAILYLVYDYLGFIFVLSVGVVILYRRGVLDTVLIAASVFSIIIGLTLIVLTVLGIQSNQKLGKVILWLIRLGNRILYPLMKRNLIEDDRAKSFARNVSEGLQHIQRKPGNLLLPALFALARKAMMMVILYLVSMAFRHPLNLDTLIAGFTTSYLFTIASITPSGVGFVEGAMTVYLTELQVPLAASAVISLAYRGITFWLFMAYGIIAIRWVGYYPRKSALPSTVSANPNPHLKTQNQSTHVNPPREPVSKPNNSVASH
ncbi:MAG: flippase-like domain-containing protein [Anaerolineales bacterium]|nr:flippase-like domain-containing protein [Anaerolineales bacterium]